MITLAYRIGRMLNRPPATGFALSVGLLERPDQIEMQRVQEHLARWDTHTPRLTMGPPLT